MINKGNIVSTLLGSSLLMLSPAAFAQDSSTDEKKISISGDVTLVTDYRFRGTSQSDNSPAIQGSLNAEFAISPSTSLYAGVWGSTMKQYSLLQGKFELDLYAGVKQTIGDIDLTAGVLYYMYPDFDEDEAGYTDPSHIEFTFQADYTIGALSTSLGLGYAPKAEALDNKRDIYIWAGASYAIGDTGFSIDGTIGYEDSAFFSDKIDYTFGISKSFGDISVSLGVAGSDAKVNVIDPDDGGTYSITDIRPVFSATYSF